MHHHTTRPARRRTASMLVTIAALAVVAACAPDPNGTPGTTTTTAPTTTTTTTTTAPATASSVYVAAVNLGAVLVVNADTVAITRTITLGVPNITSIAVAGNKLWYAWGGASGTSGVGRYDLTTGTNTTNVLSGVYSGIIRIQPQRPNLLYVGELGLSPANITKYDVSTNPPTQLARTDHGPVGSNLGDFDLSADGTRIWTACGSPYQITEIRTSDMKLSGKAYPTGPYPTGVDIATTAGGEVLLGGTNSIYDKDLHVFDAANPAIFSSYETGKWSVAGNVAISDDGTRAYGVHAADYPMGGPGELVTLTRSTGAITRTAITTAATFNNGIDTDPRSGRVFVATSNSVSVFTAAGALVGTVPAVAGPGGIVVVPA